MLELALWISSHEGMCWLINLKFCPIHVDMINTLQYTLICQNLVILVWIAIRWEHHTNWNLDPYLTRFWGVKVEIYLATLFRSRSPFRIYGDLNRSEVAVISTSIVTPRMAITFTSENVFTNFGCNNFQQKNPNSAWKFVFTNRC